MNKQVKQLWLEALRSGEYVQGTGTLCEKKDGEYRFCCLGVLCDIFTIETNEGEFVENRKVDVLSYRSDDAKFRYGGLMPRPVRVWAGVCGHEGMLVNMNDTHEKTFEEIADYIEASL